MHTSFSNLMSRLARGEIIPTDCLKFSRDIEKNDFICFSIEIEKGHLLEFKLIELMKFGSVEMVADD